MTGYYNWMNTETIFMNAATDKRHFTKNKVFH